MELHPAYLKGKGKGLDSTYESNHIFYPGTSFHNRGVELGTYQRMFTELLWWANCALQYGRRRLGLTLF